MTNYRAKKEDYEQNQLQSVPARQGPLGPIVLLPAGRRCFHPGRKQSGSSSGFREISSRSVLPVLGAVPGVRTDGKGQMKGEWIPNLFIRVFDRSLTFSEASEFILWRIGRKKANLGIEGLSFQDVDRILWGLIANIFINREYSPRGFEIGPNDTIIDIGAHKGVFVGFAAKRTGNLITAIEPDPENFRHLENFVRDNKIENVKLKKIAVDIKSGITTLYQSQSSSRNTILGADQLSGVPLTESISVEALSLSDLLAPFTTVDYLKMDCEGAEVDILTNAGDETIRKIKRLVAEVHWIGRDNLLEPLKERLARIYHTVIFVKTSANLGIIYASFDKENSR